MFWIFTLYHACMMDIYSLSCMYASITCQIKQLITAKKKIIIILDFYSSSNNFCDFISILITGKIIH